MVVGELLSADDAVQIRLHEFLDQIDLVKLVYTGRPEDVEDGDDVLVVKVAEDLYLAEGAEAVHRVVEGRDALNGDLALRGVVHGRPHDAVLALADDIEHIVRRI